MTDTEFYQPVDTNLTEKHRKEVQNFITNLYTQGEIHESMYRYLLDRECKTPNMYFLSKIHKGITPPPGRPIVSANGCPTEKISNFVDHFLNPPSTHKQIVCEGHNTFSENNQRFRGSSIGLPPRHTRRYLTVCQH